MRGAQIRRVLRVQIIRVQIRRVLGETGTNRVEGVNKKGTMGTKATKGTGDK